MPREEKIIIPKEYAPPGSATAATGLPNGHAKGATIMLDAGGIQMEPIDWLWHGWLAKSKLHLIAGAPDAGKTTIGLSLTATVSSGNYWPDGTRAPIGTAL